MPDLRSLEDLAEYAHQQVERLQRMQSDLAAQSGTADSPRGHVHAKTGPGGVVQELRIDPSGLRLSADELAEEVTAAIGAAQREFAKRADSIMEPVLNMRPSEVATDALEAGMSRLDALTDDLDRLSRRHDLT